MCFANSSSSSNSNGGSSLPDPRAFFSQWKIPTNKATDDGRLTLNEEAMNNLHRSRKGTRRLQIPVTPGGVATAPSSQLTIPRKV